MKKIIRKTVSQKTSNNIPTYTTITGNPNTTTTDPIRYIVKLSSSQTINNKKSTTMNNYYQSLPTSTNKNQRLYQNNKQKNRQTEINHPKLTTIPTNSTNKPITNFFNRPNNKKRKITKPQPSTNNQVYSNR